MSRDIRAVVLPEVGPPSVLVPSVVPAPDAGAGQAVIAVELASVTFVETQIRAGRPPNPAMAPALPVIPGNGVGGVVAEVGTGVDPALLGRRVITTTGGSGGYAERVAVDAGGLIAVPDGLGLADAVALLADGRTAMMLMRTAGNMAGETVFVDAAGGGVGSLLVQLGCGAGAEVVAGAGSPEKVALARELGAAIAVDYREEGWTDRVRTALDGRAVDVAFDGVGGAVGRAAFELVAGGGRFLAFGMSSGSFAAISDEEAASRRVTLLRMSPPSPAEARELTAAALAKAVAGQLRPVIGQTFALEDAARAHEAIESRATIGKTLLVVGDPDGRQQRRG